MRERLLAQAALWRNVYVAESDAQAEDELTAMLLRTRAHMMHVRHEYNPADFVIDPVMLNPWTDPAVGDAEALAFVLATGSLFGSPAQVREQVAALREAGVQHLLCQTGFGDMSHEQNLLSMRRFRRTGHAGLSALKQGIRRRFSMRPQAAASLPRSDPAATARPRWR